MSNARFGLRVRDGLVRDIVEGLSTENLLLDIYPNAVFGYSLRKLRLGYTGNTIRVRRSSDNTELDIGFNGNELDTGTLLSFVGSNNGFITRWYDQSFTGLIATQTSLTNQALIVSGGTLITDNGKNAIQFDGVNDFLYVSATTSGAYTCYVVASQNPLSTGFRGILTTSQMMLLSNISTTNKWGTYNDALASSQNANSSLSTQSSLMMISSGGTSGVFYKNSSNDGTYNGSGTQNALTFIGGISPTQSLNGKIQEIVFWQSSQLTNRIEIERNINTYYNIY